MPGKLDQSLDEILSSRRTSARRGGRGRRVPNATRNSAVAPVGGIKKNTIKPVKSSGKSVPNGPAAGGNSESKIIVSNLPSDVTEGMIKEYFAQSVGSVKIVTVTYGPNGVSRGIATIVFHKSGSANEALVKLNGVPVDRRPMKIEVVLDASRAPPPAPVRGLSDRITRPKVQPKQANATKGTAEGRNARGGSDVRGRGGRRERNQPRPKRKTAEELDAEMTDYMAGNANGGMDAGTTNGAVQTATNGGEDVGMEEIS